MAFCDRLPPPADLSRRVVVASKSSKMDISENRRPQDGRWQKIRLLNTQNWEWTCESVPSCVNGESCDSLAARQNPFLTSKIGIFCYVARLQNLVTAAPRNDYPYRSHPVLVVRFTPVCKPWQGTRQCGDEDPGVRFARHYSNPGA